MKTENNKPEKVEEPSKEDASTKQTENVSSSEGTTQDSSNKQTQKQNQPKDLPISALAVSSLVVSAVGLLTSFIPIVNNITPVFFVIGLGLWIPGFIQIKKGKKKSMGLAITAIILCACSIVICLACQAACTSALNSANETVQNSATNISGSSNSSNSSNSDSTNTKSEYKVGETASSKNGLNVTVVSVEGGLSNYDGSPVSKVVVKYENTGKDEESFNSYEWKAEDAQGAQTNSTIYTKADSSLALNYGKLSAGGTKTGEIYFKGSIAKMVYSSSILSSTNVKWVV